MATASPTWRTVSVARTGWGGALWGSPSLPVTTQPQMREPTWSAAMSAPVRTVTTPGATAAAAVSTVKVACGWVERTNAAYVWWGMFVSSV